MDNYKFYRKDNYIVLSNEFTKETFYGFVKEVLVGKSNLNKPHYRFFNIKDWNSDTPLLITQLLEEDGSPYTQIDFEEFYRQNTGNFNGGGTAPGVQSVTGTGVDNTDPSNPVIVLTRNQGMQNIILDGASTVYSIPHGLGVLPVFAYAGRGDSTNFDVFNTTWNTTNIIITYENPPLSGSLEINWIALK